MSAEIGSSVGNNQAALEEQRKKQQEEAAKKAQEANASSDPSAAEKTSEKTSENSKQTDTSNKENPLSTQRPGATDTSQTNETSNKLETDPSKISAKLSDSSKISDNLSTSDLIASITEKLEKTQARIDANPFNKSNNPNSAAEHIAARPDTLAFAAQQVRIETSRNREEQVRLEDDRHSHAAYQEVKSHAEKLIKDGKENEAKELLRQVIGKPETVRSVAEEVIAQRLSPQTINLKFSTNLDAGRSEPVTKMQANLHVQMTKEEHQDHTLELMNGLMEDLDESTQTFIRNEELLNALTNPKSPESKDSLNPFANLTQKTKNPFELNINLPSKSETKEISEDRFSMLHRLGSRPNQELIQKEIENRETLRETLIQQREVLLRAQANLTKLAQSGKADQIHLLFDGKGNPLDTEALKDRGSYNSGLPDELESRYRELNDFLKKDPSFESSFTTMQDSLIGLSPEEQTVRARDFLTENLQTQRETLRLLQSIDPNLNSIISDKNSSAMESLIAIDQRTISKLTQETLSRRTDLMIELHDQLTENLNSGNFQKAAIAIEKTQKDLEDEIYTYRNNKLSDYELVNRDLARTPKEDEEIQQRITALEKKFEALTDDQLNIVRGNMSNIDDHLKEFKSLNESVPLGLFEEKGWRVIGGEANIRLESIESLQNHSDRVLNNLLSQQKNIENANESMTKAQQLERYERKLEEIISQTSSNYQGAGAKAFRDGENIRRNLEGLDNFYGNTESGLKLARNAALITGVTLATGGTGTALLASGWGMTGAGLAAAGVGTTYGAGVSLLSNTAEGMSRHGNGFNNPYENVLSQTWQDTKTSASVAAATATGMNLTRALSETYKWGRLASSITGAGASGIVSTNVTYGLNAAEQKVTSGKIDINGKQYLKDLLWNTGTSMVGGAIGGKFGQWQNASSSSTTRYGLIAAEELTSISADLGLTYARDGKITTEGLLQTFQASFSGRMQAHFAHQQISGPKNELAQQIRNQETVLKSSGKLPDGVEAQTKVRVEPDGSRKVEVDAKENLLRRAMDGDIEAQKTMLEETVAHARENPIDPQVKQADGSYKTMSTHQYQALRARQELAMRSVAEAKFADAQGSNVSATKQDSKAVLAEMNKAIKKGDFTRALELAEANGVGETYRKQFDTDYEYNSKRNRETDALEQTSFNNRLDEAKKRQVLSELLSQIQKHAQNQEPRIRNSNELDSKSITKNINSKIEDIKPETIERMIQESPNPILAREAFAQMSQFGNLRSLDNFADQLAKLKEDGFRIITDSKGSLGDTLAYLQRKGNYLQDQSDSRKGTKIPQTTRLQSFLDINPSKLHSDGTTKIAIILDQLTLDSIKSNPEVTAHLKSIQEQGIELKLVYPKAWDEGINPFTPTNMIQTKFDNISNRAQKLVEEGLSSREAVSRILDKNIKTEIEELGLLRNLEILENNSRAQNENSSEKLADSLNGKTLTETDIENFVRKVAHKTEDQEIVREIIARDLEYLSTRKIAEITQTQHQKILQLAQEKGIRPDQIYFYMPHKDIKSDSINMQIYQQANGITSSQILNRPHQLPTDPKSMVVIVDDLSISGQTQMQLHAQMRIGNNYQGEIIMAPTLATPKAINNLTDPKLTDVNIRAEALLAFQERGLVDKAAQILDNQDPKLHIIPGKEYTPLIETPYFQGLSPTDQQKFLHRMQYSGRGHNGDSTSIVMPWMAPNNNNGLIQGLALMLTLNSNGIKSVTKQEAIKKQGRKNDHD